MEARIRKYFAEFKLIWASFARVAERTFECGVNVAIELPASCAYRGWERVKDFIGKCDLHVVRFDGCMLGVMNASSDVPLKKLWKVAT